MHRESSRLGRAIQHIFRALPRLVNLSNWAAREIAVSLWSDCGRKTCPKILGLPVRDWDDQSQGETPDRIEADDRSRSNLLDFSANGRIEIDQPNFTAPGCWNFRHTGRPCRRLRRPSVGDHSGSLPRQVRRRPPGWHPVVRAEVSATRPPSTFDPVAGQTLRPTRVLQALNLAPTLRTEAQRPGPPESALILPVSATAGRVHCRARFSASGPGPPHIFPKCRPSAWGCREPTTTVIC